MTTASFVSITCQDCGHTSTIPVDALLVSVVVDAYQPESALPGTDAVTAGAVAWTCDGCADLTAADLDWNALLTLITAGVTVLDDATPEELPPHPEQPSAGAPLTHDDLLALHELLASDRWFDQVITPAAAVKSAPFRG